MRSSVRRFDHPAAAPEPQAATARSANAAQHGVPKLNASLDLAAQIARARRDARDRSAAAAMLLRSWMAGDE